MKTKTDRPEVRLSSELTDMGLETLCREEEIAGAVFRDGFFAESLPGPGFIRDCLFVGCRFPGCRLRRFRFSHVVFRNCDLSSADLRECGFHWVEFVDCRLSGANFADTSWRYASVLRTKADYAWFYGSRMVAVRFNEVALYEAGFGNCRFDCLSFSRCDLSNAGFQGTLLRGLSFADSEIRGLRVSESGFAELRGLKISRIW